MAKSMLANASSAVAQLPVFLRYLLVPSKAYAIFIVGLVLATVLVCGYFYAKGESDAANVAAMFLTVCATLGLLVLPFRMRTLLASRSFLLCVPAPANLLMAAAFVIACWAAAVPVFIAKMPGPQALFVACILWALASLAAAITILRPWVYMVAMASLMIVPRLIPNDLDLKSWLLSVPVVSVSLAAILVGGIIWWALHRIVLRHPISSQNFWQPQDVRNGPGLTIFSNIKLSDGQFDRFIKTALCSSHPLLALFASNWVLILGTVLVGGLLEWFQGNHFLFWLYPEEVGTLFFMVLLILPSVTALTVVHTMCRRMRSFWLVLAGDRAALIRDLEKAFGLVVLVSFLPLVLTTIVAAMYFQVVPALRSASIVSITAVYVIAGGYWFIYVYGKENVWLAIVHLTVLPAAAGLFIGVALAAETPVMLAVATVAGVGTLALFLRARVMRRWARIDLTCLRRSRVVAI